MKVWKRLSYVTLGLLILSQPALSAPADNPGYWAGTWASGQQIPEPRNALATENLTDATLRQVVRISIGGGRLRVRISNAFGTEPLTLTSVHVARSLGAGSAKIDLATDRRMTFAGREMVTIPAGADYVSDPVDLSVPDMSDLTVTFYIEKPPVQQTSHPGSRTTSYLVHGNHVADADLSADLTFDHWFNLSGVDVVSPSVINAIVVLGDSITDGRGSTTNGNDRWPDVLASRLLALPPEQKHGVLNVGMGGNRILLDGLGPNAAARFTRDVLAQTHPRYLIIFEGINDIGTNDPAAPPEAHTALVERVTMAYAGMVRTAREHGIRVFGATVLPFSGSDYFTKDSAREADRQALNAWIRTPGNVDAVIDFDAVTRNPAAPDSLRAEFDSGDHLHPSAAGYQAMGAAIPLTLFADTAPQVRPETSRHKKRRPNGLAPAHRGR